MGKTGAGLTQALGNLRHLAKRQQFPVKPLPWGESVSSRFRVGLGKEKTGRLGN